MGDGYIEKHGIHPSLKLVKGMHGSSELSRCLKCNEPSATVHITLKTSGGFVSIDLCEQCRPHADKIQMAGSNHQVRCTRCGLSLSDIAVDGRLGCPDDYLIFADHIAKGLEQYHGSSRHVGKFPKGRRFF